MLFGQDQIKKAEIKVGELDITKPLYVSKSRDTRIEFVLLNAYNSDPKVVVSDSDRMVSHSIIGQDKKVYCAKRLQKYLNKKTNKEQYGYDSDSFIQCDGCDIGKQTALENNGISTDGQKSIEVDLVVRLIKHTALSPYNDENGEVVKDAKGKPVLKEKETIFPSETVGILRVSIGDAFFAMSQNGVAKHLSKLSKKVDKKTGKNSLESKVLVWSASSAGIDFDEVETIPDDMKDEIKMLREQFIAGEFDEFVESNKPTSYAEYYQEKFGEVYTNPLDKPFKKGVKSQVKEEVKTVEEEKVSTSEKVPF